jgi:hypothetical protein
MSDDYPYKAKDRVQALVGTLKTLVDRDPEQEVQGLALPVLDATLAAIKESMPDDPVVDAVAETFSADVIGSGETIRAADMLMIAEQLDAAIGDRPPSVGFA